MGGTSSARKSVRAIFGRVLAAAWMAAALLVLAPCSNAASDSIRAFTLNGRRDLIVSGDTEVFADHAEKPGLPKSHGRRLSEGMKPVLSKTLQPTPLALLGLGLVALSLLRRNSRTPRSGRYRSAMRALAPSIGRWTTSIATSPPEVSVAVACSRQAV